MRRTFVTAAALFPLTAVLTLRLAAQHTPTAPAAAPPRPAAASAPVAEGEPDAGAVERGKQLLVSQCGFCHGSNARGGQQGPDLIRSPLVQDDEGGKQLGAFLKVGRPEKNMPKFDLPEKDVRDLAAFLHTTIASVSNRGDYKILDILVGNARKGEAYFNGAGKCASCHSPGGDLAGIATRFPEPVELQQRLVMPRGGGRRRGPARGALPPFLDSSSVQATVTPAAGEPFTGPLLGLTDFLVVVYDREGQRSRSWLRHEGQPKVTLTDPLQAHMDQLRKWTDGDIHDMTAFLATLK